MEYRLDHYGPVGAVIWNYYWQEHYTVISHNDDGTVTVEWHGDARCGNPRERRRGTHRTPLDRRDKIISYGPYIGPDRRQSERRTWTHTESGLIPERRRSERRQEACAGIIVNLTAEQMTELAALYKEYENKPQTGLNEYADRIENDLHEHDKLLCHAQSMRSTALRHGYLPESMRSYDD